MCRNGQQKQVQRGQGPHRQPPRQQQPPQQRRRVYHEPSSPAPLAGTPQPDMQGKMVGAFNKLMESALDAMHANPAYVMAMLGNMAAGGRLPAMPPAGMPVFGAMYGQPQNGPFMSQQQPAPMPEQHSQRAVMAPADPQGTGAALQVRVPVRAQQEERAAKAWANPEKSLKGCPPLDVPPGVLPPSRSPSA